jgi:hypothetical protein
VYLVYQVSGEMPQAAVSVSPREKGQTRDQEADDPGCRGGSCVLSSERLDVGYDGRRLDVRERRERGLALNKAVEVNKQSPAAVAQSFLQANGLLT